MHKLLYLFISLTPFSEAKAQTNTFPTSGNVGIGILAPTTSLEVYNNSGVTFRLGKSTGEAYFTLGGSTTDYASINNIFGGGLAMSTGNGSLTERFRITSTGNVLIGKSTQTNTVYKLDVNGKARINEIVVNTTGADFVFAKDYRLRPLAEIEKYIQANGHLPDILPAKTMQQEGVAIGELQTKLLQKVEELTLYIISQDKKIKEQEKRLKVLEKKP